MEQNVRGQSLIETLCVLFIVSVFLAQAMPYGQEWLDRTRKAQAVNQMLGLLNYARGSASSLRRDISLCSGAALCSEERLWGDSLQVFADDNANGQREAGEQLLQQASVPEPYSWNWLSFRHLRHAAFEADGTSRAANGTLTLCKDGQPQHQIIINLTGRIRQQPPSAEARCR